MHSVSCSLTECGCVNVFVIKWYVRTSMVMEKGTGLRDCVCTRPELGVWLPSTPIQTTLCYFPIASCMHTPGLTLGISDTSMVVQDYFTACRRADPPHRTSFFKLFSSSLLVGYSYPLVDMNIPQEVVRCCQLYGVYPLTLHYSIASGLQTWLFAALGTVRIYRTCICEC